ncbi:uncharacterized protein PHALS_13549 [Plasmopara halstedii]|uniref:Uncharacterized protein n=1 Tax=Plasmopara halstedii TaxID=4781 RepID=A0A0P1APF5_PLAHL|nr:uncharacterized protein PHALS_13549 [Plasmopara halstedii]CEG43349.1 hypothetical protein PHALS_13549 [Plasmopara halstedii]|eukprot:XP_024579718.1 hypothetical protein PHALS_13549 [Plasmopara halstedii]
MTGSLAKAPSLSSRFPSYKRISDSVLHIQFALAMKKAKRYSSFFSFLETNIQPICVVST